MTDLEISKALALAIGWEAYTEGDDCYVVDHVKQYHRDFDYRDWAVIGPIAERHDCFPQRHRGMWVAGGLFENLAREDTPQKAIALAVIQGAKK